MRARSGVVWSWGRGVGGLKAVYSSLFIHPPFFFWGRGGQGFLCVLFLLLVSMLFRPKEDQLNENAVFSFFVLMKRVLYYTAYSTSDILHCRQKFLLWPFCEQT